MSGDRIFDIKKGLTSIIQTYTGCFTTWARRNRPISTIGTIPDAFPNKNDYNVLSFTKLVPDKSPIRKPERIEVDVEGVPTPAFHIEKVNHFTLDIFTFGNAHFNRASFIDNVFGIPDITVALRKLSNIVYLNQLDLKDLTDQVAGTTEFIPRSILSCRFRANIATQVIGIGGDTWDTMELTLDVDGTEEKTLTISKN